MITKLISDNVPQKDLVPIVENLILFNKIMPIQKSVTSEVRVTMNKYDISRWTSKANNQALYKSLAEASDPGMMKSDNLLFSPGQMLSGTGQTHQQIDSGYARVQQTQMQPLYVWAGGIILFVVVLRYLTCAPK